MTSTMDMRERQRLLAVQAYEVELDLTTGEEWFGSHTLIRFQCRRPGAATYADLAVERVSSVVLNGRFRTSRATTSWRSGPTAGTPATAGGLIRAAEPEADSGYVYSMSYPHAAPSWFCCFDQPDLPAPFTLTVTAPAGWTCLSNRPPSHRPPAGSGGRWQFETTRPIGPYALAVAAGPWRTHQLNHTRPDGTSLPITHAGPPGTAGRVAGAVADLLGACLAFYEHRRAPSQTRPARRCSSRRTSARRAGRKHRSTDSPLARLFAAGGVMVFSR